MNVFILFVFFFLFIRLVPCIVALNSKNQLSHQDIFLVFIDPISWMNYMKFTLRRHVVLSRRRADEYIICLLEDSYSYMGMSLSHKDGIKHIRSNGQRFPSGQRLTPLFQTLTNHVVLLENRSIFLTMSGKNVKWIDKEMYDEKWSVLIHRMKSRKQENSKNSDPFHHRYHSTDTKVPIW